MMSKIDRLAGAFTAHVAIGWPASSSGAQRVIMVVYDPSDERALRKRSSFSPKVLELPEKAGARSM
ncbi:hypothetical protein [Rhizobium sp. G21]|uniref:hypothetical protein n=1 Tax=Rhizobium sp. G21 TaxID=2758439 RepID=UPI0016031009|nr:hypothetical protein [Rhizobium sp. G21]MBB1249936.1 hypothetical protein [Rhizobium sp. G21]